MTGDDLLVGACATPSDAHARLVLADWLAENGEAELEGVLRGPDGEAVVRRTHAQADRLRRRPCLRLLWAVAVAFPQKHFSQPLGYINGSGIIPALPDYGMADYREWFNTRLADTHASDNSSAYNRSADKLDAAAWGLNFKPPGGKS